MKKKPVRKRKRTRGHKKCKVPDWFQVVEVHEKAGSITFRMEIAGLLRETECEDGAMTFILHPNTMAKEGPGPYDYMLELRVGYLVLPVAASVWFPDETTHGREFFEKVKGMLRDAGALEKKEKK